MKANPRILPVSRAGFSAALCAFINDELPRMHPKMRVDSGVSPETPLFATGLIDSMAILHVIAFVEETTGRDILPEEVVMKHFASVSAIAQTFWPADILDDISSK